MGKSNITKFEWLSFVHLTGLLPVRSHMLYVWLIGRPMRKKERVVINMAVYACVRILDFWAMCFKFDGFGFDFYFCFVKFLCSCPIVFSLLSLILFPLSSQVLLFIFLVLSSVTISISSSVLVCVLFWFGLCIVHRFLSRS